MAEFDGRVALVTGASKNIGREIALALARDGADVVVCAHQDRAGAEAVAEEARALGRKALVALADITDPDAVEKLAAAVEAEFGRVDILVLNAAVRRRAPITAMSYDEWRAILALDLDGAFLLTRAFVASMIERGQGRIITIGGGVINIGARAQAHVVAAKAGLQGFTRALAMELGTHGITVNMVSPGIVDTPRESPAEIANANALIARNALGRAARQSEVAAAVRYLASDGAAATTGQTLNVNGGSILS